MLASIQSASFGTLLSRITGFIREFAWSYFIGPTHLSDVFNFAYMLPNFLRRFLGEGAFASAFTPVMTDIERVKGTDAARVFTSRVMAFQSIITISLTFIAIGVCACLVFFGGDEIALYGEYIGVLAPYSIFICAAALLGAVLNAKGIFFLPNFVQVIMNVSWIAFVFIAAFLLDIRFGLTILGVSVVLSCAFAVWLLWRKCSQIGFKINMRLFGHPQIPEFKGFVTKYIATVIGVGAFQVNMLADRLMAQFLVLDEGSLTVLYQGERLMQYPFGLIGMSIAAVVIAELSRNAHDDRRYFVSFHKATRLSFFLAIMMTGIFCILADQAVDLTLNWGAFARTTHIDALSRTSMVLFCYGIGYPATFMLLVVNRSFYAKKDMLTPVKVGGWMIALNFTLNLLFLWVTPLNEAGLALSSTICAYLNMGILLFLLGKRFKWLKMRMMYKSVPRHIIAVIPAVALTLLTIYILGGDTGGSLAWRIIRFFVPACVFAATHIAVARFFGVREATDMLRRSR